MASEHYPTVQPGEPAPNFDLPMVVGEGRATLSDYRGRTDLLLVLLRSFECPFCRRNMAALKHTAKALEAQGTETLAVTTTSVKAARLYTKYRPPGLPLASDSTMGIHRDYGVPIYRFSKDQPTQWPHTVNYRDVPNMPLKPIADLPDARTFAEAAALIEAEEDFVVEEQPGEGPPADASPLISYFLIDRGGAVRWVNVIAFDDPSDYGQHPSHADLMAAAEILTV